MGPLPGQTPAQYAQALDRLSQELTRYDDEVRRQLDKYEVSAANKPPLEKVRIALEKGLAETALNVLEQTSTFDSSGGLKEQAIAIRTMGLLLDLGQLEKVRDNLLLPDPDMVGKPVSPQYLDFHVRLAAAHGDYDLADRHLTDSLNHAWQPPPGQPPIPSPRVEIGLAVGRVLLGEAQRFGGAPRLPLWLQKPTLLQPPSDYWVRRWRLHAIETGVSTEQQRAETYLKRGWLALEAGRCVEARQYFRTVLDLVIPGERWIPEVQKLNAVIDAREYQGLQQLSISQSVARNWAQHYLKWLDAYQH
jgi:hypothetical protein